MAEFFRNPFSYVMIFFVLAMWIAVGIRFLKNGRMSVKTVKATVVDKYKSTPATWHPGVAGNERYVVVFSANGEKLAFNVSEYSYQNYRIKDKGTLKYRGSMIIDFK